MKKFILIAGALLLVGCGPSQKEKENIAEMACAEIMATRNFESARRVRIINEARQEVGLDPVFSSSLFESSIRLGGKSACINYIIPPPPPPRLTKAERERREVAEQERKERERIRLEAEQKAEQKRKEKEEERRIYIEENKVTTYLYCPKILNPNEYHFSMDPLSYGVVINKVDDKYLPSSVFYDYEIEELVKTETTDWSGNRCDTFYRKEDQFFCEEVGEKVFRVEQENELINTTPVIDNSDESYPPDLYLKIGHNQFCLNRETLKASHKNGCRTVNDTYYRKNLHQCEVLDSKEIFDKKVLDVLKDKFDKEVNKAKEELKKYQATDKKI